MDLFDRNKKEGEKNTITNTLRDPLLSTPNRDGYGGPSTPSGGARLIPVRSLSKDWLKETESGQPFTIMSGVGDSAGPASSSSYLQHMH